MYIMMKKSTKRALTAAVAVLVVLLAVWGIRYRFSVLSTAGEPLLEYVPSSLEDRVPLSLAAGISVPSGIWSDLKKTNFFSALEEKGFYTQDSREKIILNAIGRSASAAVYASPQGDTYYLLLARLRGPSGVIRRLHRHFSSPENEIKQHGEVGIYQNGDIFYSISGRVFLASNSQELIKKSIDLKEGVRPAESFNCLYGWVQERMSRRRSGFLFTSGENFKYAAALLLGPEFLLIEEDAQQPDAYREFHFDRGVKVVSYKPLSRERGTLGRARTLELIPEDAVLVQASPDIDFEKTAQTLFDRRIIDPALSGEFKKAVSLLEKEAAIAVDSPRLPSVVPGILILAEASPGAYAPVRDFIQRSLGISFRSASYDNVEYEYGRLNLLFTRLDVSMGLLKSGRKEFIAVASSRELFEKTAAVSAGKEKSLKHSGFWKETEKHIPSRYSSAYYADIEQFIASAGPFLGDFSSEAGTLSFLAVRPFRWLGPVGGAAVAEKDALRSYSYIPVRDLEENQWAEIISAAENLLTNRN